MSQSSNKELEMAVGTSNMLESNMMEGENFYIHMETATEPDSAMQSQWTDVKNDTGQLCRVCGNSVGDDGVPIYEGQGREHQLEFKIQKHLPIQVSITDVLPLQLCYQCASTLIVYDGMVSNCLEVEKKLKAIHEAAEEVSRTVEEYDDSHLDTAPDADSDDEPLIQSKTKLLSEKSKATPIKKKILSKAKTRSVTIKTDKTATDSKEGEDKERSEEDVEDDLNAFSVSKSTDTIRRTRKSRKNPEPKDEDKPDEIDDFEFPKNANENAFKCEDCNKVFAKKYNLTAHRKALHSPCPKKYVCDICGKEFAFKSNYNTHKFVHMDLPRIFKCGKCSSAFKNARGLKNHLKTHDTDKNYVCEFCGKKFTTTINLKNHMSAHSEERPHFCEMCDAAFKRQSHLQQHQKEVHGVHRTKMARNFQCDQCPNSFTTSERLEVHKRKHTGELPFQCDKCWRGFASQMGLNVHHTMGECQSKSSSCRICNMEFKPGEEPCLHVKLKKYKVPTDKAQRAKKEKVSRKDKPRNFECELCGKTFIFNCDKRQHYRTCHTDERPFVCDECGKAFKAKNTLQNHQAVHSDSRPYPCSYCEKRFRRTEQLMLHTRTHTGEKPHLCDICNRGFAQIGDMKKHRKIHNRTS